MSKHDPDMLALAVTLAGYAKHSDTCERDARASLRHDPSTAPTCTCGLDEALRCLSQAQVTSEGS